MFKAHLGPCFFDTMGIRDEKCHRCSGFARLDLQIGVRAVTQRQTSADILKTRACSLLRLSSTPLETKTSVLHGYPQTHRHVLRFHRHPAVPLLCGYSVLDSVFYKRLDREN